MLTLHSQSRSEEWGEEGVSERHTHTQRKRQRHREGERWIERQGKQGEG